MVRPALKFLEQIAPDWKRLRFPGHVTLLANKGLEHCQSDWKCSSSVDALPPDALKLLSQAGLFGSPVWWRLVQEHAMPAGAEPVFAVLRSAGAACVLPLQRAHGKLSALTTPYTCLYAPPLPDPSLAALGLARLTRGQGVLRLDALPAEWDALPALMAGARRAGRVPLRFAHFGNWSEDVTGLDWNTYLQRRPGALRETIRRRLRQADRLQEARLELLTQPWDMDRATSAFESVYARSWKEPEPFPSFNTALMRAMANEGALRFGLWTIGGRPAAVQIWVVWEGQAIVLKLAHDEAYKAHSPGTVLTALMLRHLLEQEQVRRIDFGRGDDGYKQGWASERRQRIGVLLVNPWRPEGAAALLGHAAGRVRERVRGFSGGSGQAPAD